jgi:SAM-dependent methyltransferase
VGIDRATAGARRRHAEDLFLGRRPRATDRLLANLFFSLSAREWGRRQEDPAHALAFREGLERSRAPRNVLDLGTGTGATAAHAAARYPDARVCGIDGSARMIRIATAQHPASNLEFKTATFTRLPFADSTFDLVCALNALPEPGELARVATRDAQLLIANTYFGPLEGEGLERWRAFGFERLDWAPVGAGCWQLYERRGNAV